MNENTHGTILSGVGGLYTVYTDDGRRLPCRAKGAFRKQGLRPLPGDRVTIRLADSEEEDSFIESIGERKNALIRPPMANLNRLFVTFAPQEPEPSTLYLDKLLSIAVHNHINPTVVITKRDISSAEAISRYISIYQKAGFPVFLCSSADGTGISQLRESIMLETGICAFAGASGVGKSTLLNALFPTLALETGHLSEKISRGRHTTRSVVLYPLGELVKGISTGYIADTPGFSMLDFLEFDFYTAEDLPHCFPEFEKYLGQCRYTDCTHTKENECGITQAVAHGEIAKERHDSYLAIYKDLADKKPWQKKL